MDRDGERWLVKGERPLLRVSDLAMPGSHNQANVLAALALVEGAGASLQRAAAVATRFTGLAHRCQLVAERGGVLWLNDSKATNVGATVAALEGMNRPVVLIAGGDAKGADFSALRPVVAKRVKAVLLFGRDRSALADALEGAVPVMLVENMEQAVAEAQGLAQAGDMVLLSPACASLDMYRNFAERGEHFEALVEGLKS